MVHFSVFSPSVSQKWELLNKMHFTVQSLKCQFSHIGLIFSLIMESWHHWCTVVPLLSYKVFRHDAQTAVENNWIINRLISQVLWALRTLKSLAAAYVWSRHFIMSLENSPILRTYFWGAVGMMWEEKRSSIWAPPNIWWWSPPSSV